MSTKANPQGGPRPARYSYALLSAVDRGALPTSLTMRDLRADALLAGLRSRAIPAATLEELLHADELRGWNRAAILVAVVDAMVAGELDIRVDPDRGELLVFEAQR